jgi:hypothetical protein
VYTLPFTLARDAKKEFEKVAQKDKNNTFKFSSNILLKDKIHIISIEKPLVLIEKTSKSQNDSNL